MPTAVITTPDRPSRPTIDRSRPAVIRAAAGLLVAGLLVVSCGTANPVDGGPTVVVTTTIWADVVANISCETAIDIETLIPPGSDPHAFEPSLGDRDHMDNAALVVANGLGLEAGLDATLDAVADSTAVFRMSDHIDTIGADPHIWLDPVRVSAALPALADALVEQVGIDPAGAEACLERYQRDLELLDAETAAAIDSIPGPNRKLVTNHDALGYFANRYDLDIVGTVIPSTSSLAEPNPAQLDELQQLIVETGARAIFVDSELSSRDAEALAARVGDIDVVPLFTGGLGEPGGGADTYVALVRTNATLITAALVTPDDLS